MKILITTCGGFVKEMESWSERCLARELTNLGYEVEAITSSSVMKAFGSAKKHEIIDGINVRRFHPLLPSSLIFMLKHKWDLIHTHFPGYMAPISSWAVIRKIIKNIPIVHTVHGIYHDPFIIEDEEDPFKSPIDYSAMKQRFDIFNIKNWFAHLPIFNADIVLPQNSFEFNELKKFGVEEERMRIVPCSGILYENYRIKRYDFKERHNIKDKMILFVGQFRKRKGVEYLLNAFKNILEYYPHTTLVLIGYTKNHYLKMHTKNLKNILVFGYLNEDDKIAAYQSADVFCLPTLYEGFGLVFLEAMACNTPIVTTNIAGISELVEHGKDGILVKPKNTRAITNAVLKIFEGKYGLNSHKKASEYDWKKVVQNISKIYEELV